MLQIEHFLFDESCTVLQAMQRLDETGQRILFLAPEGKLKAALTDGDIRKHILRGGSLEDSAATAANDHPHSLPVADRGLARNYIEKYAIDALPL